MTEISAAGVSAVEMLRGRFREQVARYRALVTRSADTGGVLSEAELGELVELCEALKLPPDRFERDRGELLGLREAEARLTETVEKNAEVVADVPKLEAEIAELSAERLRIRHEADSRCDALESQMNERRREIRKETQRYREPTDRLEREILERRDANPVLFQRDVEPSEWPALLVPRKRTIRG